MKIRTAEDLARVRQAGLRKLIPDRPRIAVGLGTCGKAVGGDLVYDRLRQTIESGGLDIALTRVGCFGYCREEPLVNIAIPLLAAAAFTHLFQMVSGSAGPAARYRRG